VLGHPRPPRLLRQPERGHDVRVEDLPEGVEVEVDHRPVDRVDPDVAHEHVQAAEGVDRRAHRCRAVLGVAGVAGDGHRPAGATEGLDRLGQRLGLAGGHDDARAAVDQAAGDAQADAPAGTGHQGRAAVHRSHVRLLKGGVAGHGRGTPAPVRRPPVG
jgi:hypothetical protein